MRINLTDNNIAEKNNCIFPREALSGLFHYANKTIAELCKENDKLLIYPYSIESSKDRIGESSVFSIENTEDPRLVRLTTGNIVGFFGIGNLKIKIQSRFDKGRNDYFLHYMLQRVLSFNLFDLNHNSDEESIFDFTMFMFPYALKSALRQGIYREYQKEEHNDAKVRGVINISKFISQDLPFHGKIAYRVRNHSCDNAMTQLVRHTIEYMKARKYGRNLLNIDKDTIDNVQAIIDNTPSYDVHEREKVIQQNLRPKIHPYYTEYQPLQTLCIQILRMEEIKYGEEEDEICGILFDASWLWEEYVNTILQPLHFNHPENKTGKGRIYLFEDKDEKGKKHYSGPRYPDFYKEDFVLDAKYKRLDSYTHLSEVNRDDLHQVITYMTILQTHRGGFIAPLEKAQAGIPTSTITNTYATLSIYGIEISKATSYPDFIQDMFKAEETFVDALQRT